MDTIENRKQALEAILPEARIAIAHGQMPERDLEHVMRDFVAQRFNLLLCSTIIETGIDVPTANTIVWSPYTLPASPPTITVWFRAASTGTAVLALQAGI